MNLSRGEANGFVVRRLVGKSSSGEGWFLHRLAEGKTRSEKGPGGSRGISRDATLRLRRAKGPQRLVSRLSWLSRNGGLSEVKSAVGRDDELLVSSSLKCTSGRASWHANIDYRPFRPFSPS